MGIEKIKREQLDELFDAILSLKSREECYRFFGDLATIRELEVLSQRLEVAKMLKSGYTYKVIEEKTKSSTATISRVRRSIDYGYDGYKIVLNRVQENKMYQKADVP